MSTPQPSDPQQPRESSVIREPATVEACRRDYAAGADVRAVMDKQLGKGN